MKTKLRLTSDHYNIIAKKIKKFRVDKEISQEELAGKVNMSNTALSQKLKGVYDLTIPEAIEMCKLFNTTLDQIFLNQ